MSGPVTPVSTTPRRRPHARGTDRQRRVWLAVQHRRHELAVGRRDGEGLVVENLRSCHAPQSSFRTRELDLPPPPDRADRGADKTTRPIFSGWASAAEADAWPGWPRGSRALNDRVLARGFPPLRDGPVPEVFFPGLPVRLHQRRDSASLRPKHWLGRPADHPGTMLRHGPYPPAVRRRACSSAGRLIDGTPANAGQLGHAIGPRRRAFVAPVHGRWSAAS